MIRCFQRTASTSPPGKSATRVGAVLVGAPTPKQLFNSRVGRHLPCLRQPASQGAQAHQGDGPPSPLRRRRAGALASERRRLRGDGFERAPTSKRGCCSGRFAGELAPREWSFDHGQPIAAASGGGQGRAERISASRAAVALTAEHAAAHSRPDRPSYSAHPSSSD